MQYELLITNEKNELFRAVDATCERNLLFLANDAPYVKAAANFDYCMHYFKLKSITCLK